MPTVILTCVGRCPFPPWRGVGSGRVAVCSDHPYIGSGPLSLTRTGYEPDNGQICKCAAAHANMNTKITRKSRTDGGKNIPEIRKKWQIFQAECCFSSLEIPLIYTSCPRGYKVQPLTCFSRPSLINPTEDSPLPVDFPELIFLIIRASNDFPVPWPE